MDQLVAIIQREFIVRVRRPAFLIGTFIAPLLMIAWLSLPGMLMNKTIIERHVLVLDQSNDAGMFEAMQEKAGHPDLGTRFKLSQVVVEPTVDIEELRRQHDEEISQNVDRALIVLGPGILDDQQPEYYANNLSDNSLANLNRVVSSVITSRRLAKNGVDPVKISLYSKNSDLRMIKVDSQKGTQDNRENSWTPFVLFFLIYISVARHSNGVMMGILEEKQTRLVEIVVSSVTPFQLMAGKLIGICMVGLMQVAIWALSLGVIGSVAKPLLGSSGSDFPSFPAKTILYFIIFFLCGYFLYGTIYAILGAVASRPDDVAFLSRPVTILNLIPFFTVWIVMKDPSTPTSTVLSLIPPFAPSLMVLRIAIVPPPLWQILLSIFLILVTTAGCLWLAAKVYRVGVLLHGKRPTLAEIGRWLRVA